MGRLTHLDVEEISLVGRPANKRKFVLFKSAEAGGKEGGVMTSDRQERGEIDRAFEGIADTLIQKCAASGRTLRAEDLCRAIRKEAAGDRDLYDDLVEAWRRGY